MPLRALLLHAGCHSLHALLEAKRRPDLLPNARAAQLPPCQTSCEDGDALCCCRVGQTKVVLALSSPNVSVPMQMFMSCQSRRHSAESRALLQDILDLEADPPAPRLGGLQQLWCAHIAHTSRSLLALLLAEPVQGSSKCVGACCTMLRSCRK